jgi:hypothetical protein
MKQTSPLSHTVFVAHLLKNAVIGLLLIAVSLAAGMSGYHYLEGMSWMDAYLNASMILSGMGPVEPLKTEWGKFFAGSYALFSGIFFLVIAALVLSPIARRLFHKIHLEVTK